VVSTSGASFSWTGYQNSTTVSHEILPGSVDCARDLDGKPGVITDICVARQKAAAVQNLSDRHGCWTALAWYTEHSDAITATVGVIAVGVASRAAQKAITESAATTPGPKAASLTSVQARAWYLEQEALIKVYNAKLQAAGVSPKIRAMTAFNSRNTIRTQARAAMSNARPPPSWRSRIRISRGVKLFRSTVVITTPSLTRHLGRDHR